ncbi:MAG: hypothetical protein IPM03_17045 [Sulfuritalea sp.]|nr:hypothetical protein [Sulfuritalea sp.]
MNVEDLSVMAMAAMAPEFMGEMERTITADDWLAIQQGAIGVGFNFVIRGCSVEIECSFLREGRSERRFIISRTLAPAAQA